MEFPNWTISEEDEYLDTASSRPEGVSVDQDGSDDAVRNRRVIFSHSAEVESIFSGQSIFQGALAKPIRKAELHQAFVTHPDLIGHLTLGGKHLESVRVTEQGFVKRPRNIATYIRVNAVLICFVLFLILLNIALAAEDGYRYWYSNGTTNSTGVVTRSVNNGFFVAAR